MRRIITDALYLHPATTKWLPAAAASRTPADAVRCTMMLTKEVGGGRRRGGGVECCHIHLILNLYMCRPCKNDARFCPLFKCKPRLKWERYEVTCRSFVTMKSGAASLLPYLHSRTVRHAPHVGWPLHPSILLSYKRRGLLTIWLPWALREGKKKKKSSCNHKEETDGR